MLFFSKDEIRKYFAPLSGGHLFVVVATSHVVERYGETEESVNGCHVSLVPATSHLIEQMCFYLPVCSFSPLCTSQNPPKVSIKTFGKIRKKKFFIKF